MEEIMGCVTEKEQDHQQFMWDVQHKLLYVIDFWSSDQKNPRENSKSKLLYNSTYMPKKVSVFT